MISVESKGSLDRALERARNVGDVGEELFETIAEAAKEAVGRVLLVRLSRKGGCLDIEKWESCAALGGRGSANCSLRASLRETRLGDKLVEEEEGLGSRLEGFPYGDQVPSHRKIGSLVLLVIFCRHGGESLSIKVL